MVPLTTDYAALNTAIDGMTAGGNTNVGIGVAWGMEALTPAGPLSSAVSLTDSRVQKVLIVLTDGLNTENRWEKSGQSCTTTWFFFFPVTSCTTTATNVATIDARTLAACSAAKAAGIIVYTVRVIDGNADMLKSCATDGRFFYNVLTADDLKPAFQAIGNSLSKFRLTQ
ncbi:hypothetical protein QA634_26275 [Methylobacterium sp. CB376]|nr:MULTISPECIES: hypothetical protein [Methylobacterium]WFT83665.1 hypothetical protein QA634_26275 [Methylobacterium nodulans]